jgi:hypothetical protein
MRHQSIAERPVKHSDISVAATGLSFFTAHQDDNGNLGLSWIAMGGYAEARFEHPDTVFQGCPKRSAWHVFSEVRDGVRIALTGDRLME